MKTWTHESGSLSGNDKTRVNLPASATVTRVMEQTRVRGKERVFVVSTALQRAQCESQSQKQIRNVPNISIPIRWRG